MKNLIQVSLHTYYLDVPSKVGFYVKDNNLYLIDSGNDKEMGRLIYKIIEEKGWNLVAIINTHSHADHIGGNSYLEKKTNCKIITSKKEEIFFKYNDMESSFLYGGFPYHYT